MSRAVLPTTQAAVVAATAVAERHGRRVTATHDIGDDQTFAGLHRPGAPVGASRGTDWTHQDLAHVPHEALLEFGGVPGISVRLFDHDEVTVTVEGVAFEDVPRDSMPAFLDAVWSGLAHTKVHRFPPGLTLKVAVPGEPTYSELVLRATAWINGIAR
ncbi:hypothetical protein OG500_06675 [Kitasatospora sp. NBC_01250]|uniref:hypothetical protein n=1 Tax=unclassified Kitasatospora TaxID=2633591 RepID=UPI002E1063D8|nr:MULTISPECIES: hypothetical protein [unclassified Kitasatospora]WSJ65794.1 hypothetical protein OG294_06545 [Kitasatospora sp. NBC_01302]